MHGGRVDAAPAVGACPSWLRLARNRLRGSVGRGGNPGSSPIHDLGKHRSPTAGRHPPCRRMLLCGNYCSGKRAEQRTHLGNTILIDTIEDELDRKSVVEGKSVSVRVDLGGRRIINKTSHSLIEVGSLTVNTI